MDEHFDQKRTRVRKGAPRAVTVARKRLPDAKRRCFSLLFIGQDISAPLLLVELCVDIQRYNSSTGRLKCGEFCPFFCFVYYNSI